MSLTFDQLRQADTERLVADYEVADWILTDWGCAIAGEVGEVCNKIKKRRRGRSTDVITTEDIAEELADVVIYADLIARELGVDLGEAVRRKFNKTSREIESDVRL